MSLRNDISKLFVKGSFVQNVAFSLSGNAIVLAIGFLLTPIIARIYGPAAYGEFAVFAAIASVIQPISTMQLPAGYVAAESDKQFSALIKISLINLFMITILVTMAVIYYWFHEDSYKLSRQIAILLPVYIIFSGLFSIVRGWNIKLEEFKRSAQSKVIATLFGKSTTIGLGWFWIQSAAGLVWGSILTFLIEFLGNLSKKMTSELVMVQNTRVGLAYLKNTLYEFRSYPKFVTPNSILQNLSTQVPIYFIAAWYSMDQVGLFSLAFSLITIPVNLFGTSIASVFLAKLSTIINDPTLRNITIEGLYKKIFYLGFIGLIILALGLKLVLPIILGEVWSGSGELAALIALSFPFALVAQPISITYRLAHLENVNLVITLIFLGLKILSLIWVASIGDFKQTIFAFLLVSLCHHGVQIIGLYKKLDIDITIVTRDLVLVIVFYLTIYFIF